MNAGSMVFVIGHELSYAIDPIGATYDEHRNLNNWMTNSSSTAFQEYLKCISDVYSEYKVEQVQRYVDGYETVNENLAVSIGLEIAVDLACFSATDMALKVDQDHYSYPPK